MGVNHSVEDVAVQVEIGAILWAYYRKYLCVACDIIRSKVAIVYHTKGM